MKDLDDIIATPNISIKEVLKIIEDGVKQIALIVDRNKKLIGTVNDGDIRRAILKGYSLNDSIENIYFRNPTVANINNSKEEIINICRVKKIHQIPVVDDNGNLIGIEILDELIKPKDKTNKVILMVGGLGTRLRPLTETTPKPMLKVGNKPILQTIVEKFAEYGYTNIIMCVNYKSHIIQDYFKDGSDFGVNIEYIFEEQRMGTAGALSLLKEKPNEPFFVMNGDLLTNVNFEHLHNYHIATNSIGTMCVREYDFQVPYGVVNIKDSKIASIEEKPTHKFFVSAGIYMLSSEVLNYIPENQFYDMPTLFEKIISEGKNAISFPLREYWLDIGRMEEYKKANDEYDEVF
ncbi:nucleotidyltransferase family protein [Aliarcobacter butzleri]|uniref:nucleotidyltransferase family protein n=1 Tax=Aliarcobacter butzleri TaxID=28197 RepID=UPI0021B3282B|nr:nucleotidyltransferase family protein [Aliarcobacter butzleri]MCT7648033.1 nucleotidyltransferase family protein [Aliarcobacter butzleri]